MKNEKWILVPELVEGDQVRTLVPELVEGYQVKTLVPELVEGYQVKIQVPELVEGHQVKSLLFRRPFRKAKRRRKGGGAFLIPFDKLRDHN